MQIFGSIWLQNLHGNPQVVTSEILYLIVFVLDEIWYDYPVEPTKEKLYEFT